MEGGSLPIRPMAGKHLLDRYEETESEAEGLLLGFKIEESSALFSLQPSLVAFTLKVLVEIDNYSIPLPSPPLPGRWQVGGMWATG